MHVVMLGDYPASLDKIRGGVEAVVLYLTQTLQTHSDLKLDVITLSSRGTEKRVVKHNGTTVHYLPRVNLPSRLSYAGNIRQMRDEILALKPDLVHAHIAGEFAEAAAETGLPWILTMHGIRFLEANLRPGLLNRYRGWFIKREELHALKRAKHIISISPFVQAAFNGQIKGQVYDVENPVKEDFFQADANKGNPYQLLFLGRLIRRKGVHTLLQAFAELHQRIPEATLRLAGGGVHSRAYTDEYYQGLKQFVAEAGLEKAVTFLGEIDEAAVIQEYEDCAALVLPSILETASMVILQAMAVGKPVISTDVGGAKYLIEHGRSGLLVPSNNASALTEALYQALSDTDNLIKMGQRGKELALQRFHVQVVADKTRELYYKVLGEPLPVS